MSVQRHYCPRASCPTRRLIDNRLFCCAPCWFVLSRDTRDRISATAKMPLLSLPRRQAIEAAMAEWRAIDGRPQQAL